jgi:hypothetical protein
MVFRATGEESRQAFSVVASRRFKRLELNRTFQFFSKVSADWRQITASPLSLLQWPRLLRDFWTVSG